MVCVCLPSLQPSECLPCIQTDCLGPKPSCGVKPQHKAQFTSLYGKKQNEGNCAPFKWEKKIFVHQDPDSQMA